MPLQSSPLIIVLALSAAIHPALSFAEETSDVDTRAGDELVTQYFRQETEKLTRKTFADIHTLEDWESRRGEYRRELLEMLGLDPLPERTPLQAVVTGQIAHDDFVVENLHFQSRPGLYVTANLYRPASQTEALPAVLYVCGHGGVKKDGVSLGNKTHYQHHGAWFARNGYVCLTIDTIQLGEIEGIHHGTYREKMWWWNSRGYSPAGVEAWNCIRALDYLQSREEVDGERIGVTGRSGGGAYSWWIAALDDRIQVAVPVAGITSLHNHVVDGCVEGHCDCMYMVNTYRWDYPMVAALVAPRPLLISNTDKDRIFPLDGVIDVHAKVRQIYRLYDAEDKLGLHITEGPHKDTQELRVHAFRWFNRFLKNDEELIETTAVKYFEPQQLKVFEQLPTDELVTSIHESFVPAVSRDALPESREELKVAAAKWIQSLREKTFLGWPAADEVGDLDVDVVERVERDGVVVQKIDFNSQSPYRLSMYAIESQQGAGQDQRPLSVSVLDQAGWDDLAPAIGFLDSIDIAGVTNDEQAWVRLVQEVKAEAGQSIIYIVPRGVGPTQWSRDERKRTQVRRRFMQLGQTAASMQIWDVRRALQAIDQIHGGSSKQNVRASKDAAVWLLYASLFESSIGTLTLEQLPTTNRDAPDLLNVSRFTELTQLLLAASERVKTLNLLVDEADVRAWQPITHAFGGEGTSRIQIKVASPAP